MKAVLMKAGQGSARPVVSVSELSVPSIGKGELLVEMKACGLCGTDIEKLRGEYAAAMPVLGHEAVGVVARVGGAVKGINQGDHVFPHHHVSCGRCYFCRSGSETMCANYKTSNLDPGGFSEYFRVPEWNVSHGGVLKLPSGVSFDEASLVEPVACCMRALDRCGIEQDESVLVVGAGPVGMAHALLLAPMKAKVMISDINEDRLGFARAMQAGMVIDAGKLDVPMEVRERTEGRGADLAIAASGSQRAILQALKSVRKGGKVCIFGVPPKGTVLEYDISDPYNSEVSIISSYGASDLDTTKALKLVASHRVAFASLITHRFHIDEFDRAVEAATAGKAMKVVITP